MQTRWSAIAVAMSLILLALSPAIGKELRLEVEDLDLVVPEGEGVPEPVARVLLAELRTAFARTAKRLSLSSREIFHKTDLRPAWVPEKALLLDRITAVVREKRCFSEQGFTPYLRRFERGIWRIHLTAPAGRRLTADEKTEVGREIAFAIMAHTLGDGCPVWLREGLAEALAEEGTKGEGARHESYRRKLAAPRGLAPLAEVLAASDVGHWGRLDGRAQSWALARLLLQANPKLLIGLYEQSRIMMSRLTYFPDRRTVRKEFADTTARLMRQAGATPEELEKALADWIAQGFPEGRHLRRTDEWETLRRLKLPPWLFCRVQGTWGRSYYSEPRFSTQRLSHNLPFKGGTALWRLPWKSHMKAYIGVKNATRRNGEIDYREAFILPIGEWTADAEGRFPLKGRVIATPDSSRKLGFIMLAVSSPAGIGFTFSGGTEVK